MWSPKRPGIIFGSVKGNERGSGRVLRGFSAAAACLGIAASVGARAEVRPYTFEVPEGSAVSFQIEFEVEHPGKLQIQADWTGPRVLSFRLERSPGRMHKGRRTGPSPQSMAIDVHPWDLTQDGTWTLDIRALAARGAGSGTVTLVLPDPPEVVARRQRLEEQARSGADKPLPTPSVPPPEPWMIARRPPSGASEQVRFLFEKVEAFRGTAVGTDGLSGPDACRWQADTLGYLAGWRDRLSGDGEIPPISSRRYFSRLVAAIRTVDDLRNSEDPILAGPPPEERLKRKAWLAVRRQRIEPIEQELDALIDDVTGGHAPELQEMQWPTRLISCLMACERHFEERVRLGENQATNGELAEIQWERIVAAGEALEALVYLTATENDSSTESISQLRD
jgi:hypothetical protein